MPKHSVLTVENNAYSACGAFENTTEKNLPSTMAPQQWSYYRNTMRDADNIIAVLKCGSEIMV